MDLLIGYGFPVGLIALYAFKKIPAKILKLFGLGALIGLTWEVPIFVLSARTSMPVIVWVRELPAHYLVFMIGHTLWDGAIFLVGALLAGVVGKKRFLQGFQWGELAVLAAWGQVTALLVELSSVTNRAWVYVEGYWWNPTFARVGDYPLTLLMQVVWFVAPVVFYLAAIRLMPQDAPKSISV
ncbi:MAG: hypothetical protein H6684_03150 [Deltaproteobacteria bacterium]|nr:hypothetical protein [Deltaproteobacteria bacterium]